MDCIFCKIIKKEIPSQVVYEDEVVLAFLDAAPINPGHTLLVPKEHFRNTLETSELVLARMGVIAKKLGKAIIGSMKADGCNILANNEEAAGQVVFHTHWHIFPRFSTDGYHVLPGRKVNGFESEEIAEQIKKYIN